MLIIRQLNYTYPHSRSGLREINLEVPAGMRLALVGKNGSGKTTLLLHIVGLLDGSGHMEIAGLERKGGNMAEIRRRVGFLFSQVEYQFIMPDVLNDVLLGVRRDGASGEEALEEARRWLSRFGLEKYQGSSPLELSSGEMKRAALAGILASGPRLLLLDEPLNNLDRENSLALIASLKSLETTMILSTHRDLLVRELATHVALMEEGTIAGIYPRREALKRRDITALLF